MGYNSISAWRYKCDFIKNDQDIKYSGWFPQGNRSDLYIRFISNYLKAKDFLVGKLCEENIHEHLSNVLNLRLPFFDYLFI